MDKEWLNECISKFEGYRSYDYGNVKILISNTKSTFDKGIHKHIEYEFMSVRCQDVTTLCNGKRIVMKKGYIMPFIF